MQQVEAAKPGCALGLSTAQVKQVMWAATTGWSVPAVLHGRALQIPPRWRGIPVVTRRLLACAKKPRHACACVDHQSTQGGHPAAYLRYRWLDERRSRAPRK